MKILRWIIYKLNFWQHGYNEAVARVQAQCDLIDLYCRHEFPEGAYFVRHISKGASKGWWPDIMIFRDECRDISTNWPKKHPIWEAMERKQKILEKGNDDE